MQPEDRDAAYLWDMLEAANEVMEMMEGYDLDGFLENKVLVRAIERTLEIMGEAARRVSPQGQAETSSIPWREIIGQRNLLAHEYGQIDKELLHKTVVEDVPRLVRILESALPPE